MLLAGPDDVARLAHCTSAAALTIRTAAPLDLSAMQLAEIRGDLVIGPSVGIEVVLLPALRSVGGRVHASSNASLRAITLPALATAGALEVDGDVSLTTLALPHLAAVAGGVSITDGPELELIDLPALTAIGGALVITDHPKLAAVELGAVTAASVRIDGVPALPPELAAQLRQLPTR
jgi:hypothetical protein